MSESHEPAETPDWPLRPLLLALVGLAAGYGVYLIVGDTYLDKPTMFQLASLVSLIVGAGLFGFTLERRHWLLSLIFSLGTAAVAGGIIWWNGNPDHWGGGDGWRLFALLIAIVIAAPLFQTARDEGALSFPYAQVHDHAWANIVLWCACCAFVLIVWVLSWLLASLFLLIDITLLRELLQKNWFAASLIGLSFGAALGLLRDHDFVVRLLQRVVATVLAVLAPVLAVGLIVFLLALPFTGLAPLWKQGYATSTLLACAAGALILANVVIGSTPEQERRFPPLRFGAIGLALVMLPLAILAAVAIGLRIDQYGFSPERLWALTFIVIASAFGLAYLVSLVRGRMEWAEKVRPANLILVFAVCGIALVLATPLISFNAISTRDQVARLESGKLTADKFDWAALAFDFGESGRKELTRLTKSANATIRAKAVEAAKAEDRWVLHREPEQLRFTGAIEVMPAGSALPDALGTHIISPGSGACGGSDPCRVFLQPDGRSAVVLRDGCAALPPERRVDPKTGCAISVSTWLLEAGQWRQINGFSTTDGASMTPEQERDSLKREQEAIVRGEVTIRPVTRRQVFIGDKPHGQPFE